jgi:hypothetical protein
MTPEGRARGRGIPGRKDIPVVSTAMMALGFAGVGAALSLNFYRKYQARLQVGDRMLRYARVADYSGIPLRLAFEYLGDEDALPVTVEVDVHEIYHYGPDYFLRGFGPDGRRGLIFKWNRIQNLRLRATGRNLGSVSALLGVAENPMVTQD